MKQYFVYIRVDDKILLSYKCGAYNEDQAKRLFYQVLRDNGILLFCTTEEVYVDEL